ncbi:MAG TPA: tetratricopeptide repeat protein [candidate division Zixibacteria bacterium]|nr:tetratricopeptide repeat protein [candidate division Zixibacteria bacterium]
MQQKVKLTKRQIKEDKFTIFMLKSRGWFQDNWQFVTIGLVVVILLSVAVVYYAQSRVTSDEEAAAKFAEAVAYYRRGNTQEASMRLQTIVSEHSSSSLADEATYLLGNLNLRSRNYSEATRYYEIYLKETKGFPMTRAAAAAGIAVAYENQSMFTEAADYYLKAIKAYPDGPLDGDYSLALMRCYLETEQENLAREQLDHVTKSYQGTELANRAIRIFQEKYPG